MGWFCHQSDKTCSIKHICPECLSQGFQSGCDRQLLGFGLPVKSETQGMQQFLSSGVEENLLLPSSFLNLKRSFQSARAVFEEQHNNSELKCVT